METVSPDASGLFPATKQKWFEKHNNKSEILT